MPYYSKRTDRMDLHIEADRGTILIKQRWEYTWLTSGRATAWTYAEKRAFHEAADSLVWNQWGRAFFLRVRGSSRFAREHADVRWDVNFDLEWVLSNRHWNVRVTKLPASHTGHETSYVQWGARTITLDTKDTAPRQRVRGGRTYSQYPLSHEFGHAAGNSGYASPGMHADEYKPTSPYVRDRSSLMNVGNQLRSRHLDFIVAQLNTMIPDTTFETRGV